MPPHLPDSHNLFGAVSPLNYLSLCENLFRLEIGSAFQFKMFLWQRGQSFNYASLKNRIQLHISGDRLNSKMKLGRTCSWQNIIHTVNWSFNLGYAIIGVDISNLSGSAPIIHLSHMNTLGVTTSTSSSLSCQTRARIWTFIYNRKARV